MSTGSTPAAPTPLHARTFLGHPLGLYVLFFTEMWERFSYYGMRGLLMLYMINYFRWVPSDASTVYKIYTTLVYVTPILGGFLADRYLGNRMAVIIGATLMAIGHFLMAFEDYPIFLTALGFLIIGNGFFKPNMSTIVGRLYPANDPRRDGAYTIFYMGINLGAFLSPLVCGWLAENTLGSYHSGFTMAGIGMVIGLVTYLLGQPLIKEIVDSVPPAEIANSAPTPTNTALSEAEAAKTPSVLGGLSKIMPTLLFGAGGLMVLTAVILLSNGTLNFFNAVMLALGGISSGIIAWLASKYEGGLRDRILAIVGLGIFVIFFWAAFEQAGNVLNIWADKHTLRYMNEDEKAPTVRQGIPSDPTEKEREQSTVMERLSKMFVLKETKAEVAQNDDKGFLHPLVNPIPTAWFQSINAVLIVLIAPIMAWLWLRLGSKQPSIPMKMAIGLGFMSASTAVMISAARSEGQPYRIELKSSIEQGTLKVGSTGQLMIEKETPVEGQAPIIERHAANQGRITIEDKMLVSVGVLPDIERDRIIAASAPKAFQTKLAELAELSKKLEGKKNETRSVTLDAIPEGFDLGYAGLPNKHVRLNVATKELITEIPLQTKEQVLIGVAAGNPEIRELFSKVMVESTKFRVSPMWLVLAYLLATVGELCLSPIGLSMVNKLAPRQYSTMLMGIWMLTSAFGNFVAGSAGEFWDVTDPVQFFLMISVVVGISSLVLLVTSKLMNRLMHGVS
ncbi:peptide MFS transporter [Tuwongella immobilis]|uniref:Major facilitator superfamily (MFS) profile domain-containing protein n=1 Tax=Tuwongella immobilis TaxID=692036 RepID=A0A6C2YWB1_9BACT|nr:peptide MFS transporter [Tuwongella immobilis]VIP05155.1 mfs transporter : Di-/tripeptide transporter OS=Chondromyces apiculatus DSM 436 GN=CAP_4111 PE=3 SV=1: PTR2: PTR2 [Tuwongella immobilis]VTS07666.1 mfs transporter : Di-/tripeptide transporter OS=Chondromyces apiculatus DSM 436 GN=CAP_4111 PE=3 SV=1: PTR2: PTR2 [Tuwongella immobilis]